MNVMAHKLVFYSALHDHLFLSVNQVTLVRHANVTLFSVRETSASQK